MRIEIRNAKTPIQSTIDSINKILREILIIIVLTILFPILFLIILNLDSREFMRWSHQWIGQEVIRINTWIILLICLPWFVTGSFRKNWQGCPILISRLLLPSALNYFLLTF